MPLQFKSIAPSEVRNERHRYWDKLPADEHFDKLSEKKSFPNITSISGVLSPGEFKKQIAHYETGETRRVSLDALRAARYVNQHWDRLSGQPEGLREWQISASADADLTRAANRGTAGHEWIEVKLNGEEPVLMNPDLEEYVPAMQAALDWTLPRAVVAEMPVYSREHDFVGTIDLAGIEPNTSQGFIGDYKFRGPDAKHGCWEKEVAQLGLAALCEYGIVLDASGKPFRVRFEDLFPEGLTDLRLISIKPDSIEVYPVDVEEARQVALWCLEIKKKKGKASYKASRKSVGDATVISPEAPKKSKAKATRDAVKAVQDNFPGAQVVATTNDDWAAIKGKTPEGIPIDLEQGVERLRAGVASLGFKDEDWAMTRLNTWIAQGDQNGVTWRFSDRPYERRLLIYQAAMTMLARCEAAGITEPEAVDAEVRDIIEIAFTKAANHMPAGRPFNSPIGALLGVANGYAARCITALANNQEMPEPKGMNT